MLSDLETLGKQELDNLRTDAFTLQNGNAGNLEVISRILSKLTITFCSWVMQPHVTEDTCKRVHKERTEEFTRMLGELTKRIESKPMVAGKLGIVLHAARQMTMPMAVVIGAAILKWGDNLWPMVKAWMTP